MAKLDGLHLEHVVALNLALIEDLDYTWLNRYGEQRQPEDFRVAGVHLDAKGSTKYEGSAFLTLADFCFDAELNEHDPIWYVTNTLEVISFTELAVLMGDQTHPEIHMKEYYDRSLGRAAWGARFVGLRSLEDWVAELLAG